MFIISVCYCNMLQSPVSYFDGPDVPGYPCIIWSLNMPSMEIEADMSPYCTPAVIILGKVVVVGERFILSCCEKLVNGCCPTTALSGGEPKGVELLLFGALP